MCSYRGRSGHPTATWSSCNQSPLTLIFAGGTVDRDWGTFNRPMISSHAPRRRGSEPGDETAIGRNRSVAERNQRQCVQRRRHRRSPRRCRAITSEKPAMGAAGARSVGERSPLLGLKRSKSGVLNTRENTAGKMSQSYDGSPRACRKNSTNSSDHPVAVISITTVASALQTCVLVGSPCGTSLLGKSRSHCVGSIAENC